MQHRVTIQYQGYLLAKIIESKKPIGHYIKHYPRAGHLSLIHRNRRHAEDKLAILQRVVHFMDHYDLISCTRPQSSLQALSLGRRPTRLDQPPCLLPRNYHPGWDHVSYWRRAGDKAPRVVVSEPYHLDSRTVQAYTDLALCLNLDFEVSNTYALWHPPATTAVLWHRAHDYLTPSAVVADAA